MKFSILSLIFFCCFVSVFGQIQFQYYDLWTTILQRHVTVGGELAGIIVNTVNYTSFASDPDFQTFLGYLEQQDTSSFSYEEFYAFFINVYNAMAIKTIISNPCQHDIFGKCGGPLKSIKNVGNGLFSQVWTRPVGNIGGKNYTLDDIEDLLRSPNSTYTGFAEDPRLHAAIVCASISCPNLRNEAYYPTNISDQLRDNMQDFLSNTGKGLLLNTTTSPPSVHFSSIFEWFGIDFINANGSVINFITQGAPYGPFVSDEVSSFLLSNNASIETQYFSYDWNLNGYLTAPGCSSRTCFPYWGLIVTAAGTIVLIVIIIAVLVIRTRQKRKGYQRINS